MRRWATGGVWVVATVAATGLSVVNIWPLVAVVATAWGVTASHRLTPSASLSLGIAAAGFPMFGAALAGPYVEVSLRALTVSFLAVSGICAAFVSARSKPGHVQLQRTGIRAALAAGTGAIVWLAALGLSHLLPTAAPMSWAMAGDSAPHTALSIAVAEAHGVTPAVLVNDPVPLLHVIIAEVGGERMVTSVTVAVGAMASTWAVLIALSGLMAGLVARELSRRRGGSRATSDFIALVGGILPLTWFVTGYPMNYGFVNSHLVLVLTLMVVAAALALRDGPWWSAVILTVSGTALLVAWSPLVILTVPVFVVASVRIWMTRERPSRASGVLLAVALGAAAAYVLGYQLKVLSSTQTALATDGGLAHFPEWMLPTTVLVCVALAWIPRPRDRWLAFALSAFGAAGIVGLVATVELAGNPLAGPWTYYPHKFAWQLAVTLLVIIVGLAGGIAAKRRREAGAVLAIMALVVVGALGGLGVVPSSTVRNMVANPVVGIVAGSVYGSGDRVYDEVVAASMSSKIPVLWKSGDPREQWVNHWTLEIARAGRSDEARAILHTRSYFLVDAASVCELRQALGENLVVLVEHQQASAELRAACPDGKVLVGDWDARAISEAGNG